MVSTSPHAIIIGAGFTGCALAHDLALRGFHVSVLERGEIASGTSGRTHGLLHSGGRYCVTDPEAAIECIEENIILRKIARQCIEFNGGLFVALNDEDVNYASAFEKGAAECGIPAEKLTHRQALQIEPNLNPGVLLAYQVPDGTFDPLRLALAFAASARQNEALFFTHHRVINLQKDIHNRVTGVEAINQHSGQLTLFSADIVINATGAWAGEVASFIGIGTVVRPTPGVMVAYDQRLVQRVINRLCPPADGDILLPQRRMVVIGTTSYEVDEVDYIPVEDYQVDEMQKRAIELVPAIKVTNQRGAYMSARPLIPASDKGRSLSRTFKCYDHEALHGIPGFVTITGGKATTCRAMAKKTADLVCEKLGISSKCQTKDIPLVSYRLYYAQRSSIIG